ncbi:hypothetical protein, partial [Leptospira selangorensis]|uniref:hypothetical protein n=1 Tax=Leptospira selangorensis TaxID=2484982 RepID=UPI001AEFCBDF
METKGKWLFGSGIHGNIRQSQVAKPQFVMVDEEMLHKKDVSILLFRIDLKDREMTCEPDTICNREAPPLVPVRFRPRI